MQIILIMKDRIEIRTVKPDYIDDLTHKIIKNRKLDYYSDIYDQSTVDSVTVVDAEFAFISTPFEDGFDQILSLAEWGSDWSLCFVR